MSRLIAMWAFLLVAGTGLLVLDTASQVLISIKGVPALGVLGGALILLVISSMLNWTFKEAWEERNRQNREDEPAG